MYSFEGLEYCLDKNVITKVEPILGLKVWDF